MTVATWEDPIFTAMSAAAYKAALDAVAKVAKRGAQAFAPHEESVPAMTVRVDAGPVFYAGALTEVAAQSTAVIVAPVTNPRIDRVVTDLYTGAVSVVTGVEDVSPTAPAVPAGKRPCAQVSLLVASTAVTNSMITDERTADVVLELASQAEAEAGVENTKAMTALRTAQALAAARSAPVRQSIRLAARDASGYNAMLSAGAALNFDVDATLVNAILDFADGAGDLTTTLSSDQTNQGSLAASNTNFIHATRDSASAVTWGNCLISPQYGYAFDRTQNSILHFEEAAGAPLDDFGNTWALNSTATISTTKPAYGSRSLDLAGTGGGGSNAEMAYTTGITSLGDHSWEMTAVVWHDTLPSAGNVHYAIAAVNDSGFGVACGVGNSGGTVRFQMYASANGTSLDILATTSGTVVPTSGRWWRYRLQFDALAGKYQLFMSDGGTGATPSWGAETKDVEGSSTARVCAFTRLVVGGRYVSGFTGGISGYVDEFRLARAASAPAAETPSGYPRAVTDLPVHFFSIPEMKMYEVTAASASAGVNPTLTARIRLFVGEQDTNGSAVTATRNYAIRGEYVGAWTPNLTSNAFVSASHNIGTAECIARLQVICRTTDGGYSPGDILDPVGSSNGVYVYPQAAQKSRNSCGVNTGSSGTYVGHKTAGTVVVVSGTLAWGYRFIAKRNF